MDIKVDGSKIVIDNTEIDLIEYAGQKVTVFQEDDGSYTTESKPTHKLAICEMIVPEAEVIQETENMKIKDGNDIETRIGDNIKVKETILPLDLSRTKIHKFNLGGA